MIEITCVNYRAEKIRIAYFDVFFFLNSKCIWKIRS